MSITLLTEPTVELLSAMGNDLAICEAAWVSTNADRYANSQTKPTIEKQTGLINYLMEHRHGTPFEHAAMRFYVSAPIFVFREFHRHRIGFSYNEMSGRYTELPPEFYIPGEKRQLINYGSSARPNYRDPETQEEIAIAHALHADVNETVFKSYLFAWNAYKKMLDMGIAKEVARIVLPVGIFSRMHVTCNPRSLMAFLSLRVHDQEAKFVSHPQYEIEQVALQLENYFAKLFPITYAAFIKNGRVGP